MTKNEPPHAKILNLIEKHSSLDDLPEAIELLMAEEEPTDDLDVPTSVIDEARAVIRTLDREAKTATALYFSLCPLHLVDYAICFDDQDPECAAIRVIHPNHDT